MSDWPQVPIGEVMAGFFDGPHATPAPADDGPIYLGIKNITEDGHLDLSQLRHISWDDFPRWIRRVEPTPGDLVFTYEASLHRYAMVPNGFKGCLGRRTALIRPDQAVIDGRFLLYQFLGPQWRGEVTKRLNIGSTVDRVPLIDFPSFPIHLPPLDVQRRIAAVLAAYDELIENNLRRIEVLEDMARAVFREWFVNFRFPGHEAVRLIDSRLGPIPDGWDESTVGEAAANFDRRRKPLSKMQRAAMHGEYPYYGAAKVFDHVDDYIFDGEYLLVAEDGSVVTAEGYPVLQLACGKFWANNHTHILQGVTVSTHHLYLVLSRVQVMGYVTGAAQPKITQGALNRIPLVVPPQSIRDRFDDFVRPMFGLRQNLLDQNASLRSTRDLVLPKLVAGEIDVSEVDIETAWLAS